MKLTGKALTVLGLCLVGAAMLIVGVLVLVLLGAALMFYPMPDVLPLWGMLVAGLASIGGMIVLAGIVFIEMGDEEPAPIELNDRRPARPVTTVRRRQAP